MILIDFLVKMLYNFRVLGDKRQNSYFTFYILIYNYE